MPYYLSPEIHEDTEGFWFEGPSFQKESIYKIEKDKLPPINYDKLILKSHSLTHIEGSKHVDNSGKTVDKYFNGDYLFGKATVVRLTGDNFRKLNDTTYHWEVSLLELKTALNNIVPHKLLLTVDNYPKLVNGYHDPSYVLTLGQEASEWLVSHDNFNLYGTSWKSSDFKPGSAERPIHKTLFKQAVILECLDLKDVPSGDYFLVAAPIRLVGVSESPVCPMLFTKEEIFDAF